MAKTRPTILQIIPELDTGGAELSTIEIADAVERAGGHAVVLTEGGRLVQRLRDTGAQVQFFPAAAKNPFRLMWNVHQIAEVVRREGVDLIHARSRAPAWSALYAARRVGVPFVTTYHGVYGEKTALKRLYNSVMARGDVVIANSHYTAEQIRSRYKTQPKRIEVIYRGVDGALFDPEQIEHHRVAALRSAWGIGQDERVVLQAARLTSWKGQGVLIEAARLLNAQGDLADVVFILAGDTQKRKGYEASLASAIRTAGLENRVRLVGHVDDMPAAFLTAHVAVVASTEPEAFGRTATEAQVMGTPIIATDIGAPPETVLSRPYITEDAATGWLVPPGNAARLSDALVAVLALPPEERARMGARARAHVLQTFSLKAMKEQTLRIYDRLLGTNLATGG